MLTSENEETDDGDIVFRDLIMLMLSGFVTVAVLLLAHINQPSAPTAEGMEPPGNVVIEARWPDAVDADVDLWIQGPGDVPVGYSNKGGKLFNLLRDDLGLRSDATELNYEVAYSRGVAGGEYVVNVHLFRNNARRYPVPVTLVASVKRRIGDASRQLVTVEGRAGARGPGADGVPLPAGCARRSGAGQRACAAEGPALVEAVMSSLTLLFAAAAVLAVCLSSIAVWAPRRLPAKLLALAAAALFLPLGYVAATELLSRPKPLGMEWLAAKGEVTVLGSLPVEGKHIFVWLRLQGTGEPRAYTLPWSRRLAEQLQGAERQAAEAGSEVRMRDPFGGEPSLDDGPPRFYAAPQLPSPPKAEAPPAQTFVRPSPV